MRRRQLVLAGTVAILARPLPARAAGKTPKIGLLQPGPRPPAWIEAFRQGLPADRVIE